MKDCANRHNCHQFMTACEHVLEANNYKTWIGSLKLSTTELKYCNLKETQIQFMKPGRENT